MILRNASLFGKVTKKDLRRGFFAKGLRGAFFMLALGRSKEIL